VLIDNIQVKKDLSQTLYMARAAQIQ